jgi:hypothetical protein
MNVHFLLNHVPEGVRLDRESGAGGLTGRGLYRIGKWPIKRHLRTIRH